MGVSESWKTAAVEQRACVRHSFPETVQINNGRISLAKALNLSCDGIGVELHDPLTPGFDLEVIFLNGVVKTSARVSYCNRLPNRGGYRAGLRFENDEEDLVDTLIASRKQDPLSSLFSRE